MIFLEMVIFQLLVAICLAFYRLVRGPSPADRVVAADLIGVEVAGVTGVYAVLSRHAIFLDVALVLALLSFLGTVAYAHYLARKASR